MKYLNRIVVAFNILLGLDTQTCTTKKLVDGTAERVNELTEKARRSVLLHLNQVISDRESIAPRLIPCSRHVYFITVLREIVSIIEQSLNRHENCYTKEPTTFTVPKEIVPEMSRSNGLAIPLERAILNHDILVSSSLIGLGIPLTFFRNLILKFANSLRDVLCSLV